MNRAAWCWAVFALICSSCARLHPTESYFLHLGKSKLADQDYARAILAFKNAVKLAPHDPEPLYQMAVAYEGAGNLAFTVGYLRKAIKVDQKCYPAQLKLAEILSAGANGNRDLLTEAEQHARVALQSSSEEATARRVLALTLWREGHREKGEQLLENTIRKFPQDGKAKLALADLNLRTGRMPEAEKLFRSVVQRDPKNVEALLGMAVIQLREGKIDQADQTYRQISSVPGEKYRPLHAEFLLHAGHPKRAVAELEQLAKQTPGDHHLSALLATAYIAAHRDTDAEQLLGKLLRQNPADKGALLQRAKLYLSSGKLAQAQLDLNKLLRLEPDSFEAHYLHAGIHRRNGQILQARQELAKALKLNPAYLPARIELADLLLESNSAQAALDLCNAAPKSQQTLPKLIVERNRTLSALGDFSELRTSIDRGLKVARTPDLLLQDGELKLRDRDFARARADAHEVLSAQPDDVSALNLLARTYTVQKQIPEAIQAVRNYAESRPASTPIQQFYGEILAANGNLSQSRAIFERLRNDPAAAASSAVALAQIDLAQGGAEEADRLLAPVADRGNVPAMLWLAVAETRAQKFSAAMADYRRVLASDPENALALNNLSFLLSEHGGNPAEALKFAQSAAEHEPQNPDIEGTLAVALYRNGLYRQARESMEDAISKKDGAIRRYYLSLIEAQLGDDAQSRRDLKTAMHLDAKAVAERQQRQ